jgi:nitroreductase
MHGSFIDLATCRHSVRSYASDPVEQEKIIACVEAARLAPSACNSQPWKFVIVDDPDLKRSVAEATSSIALPLNHFTNQAPVLVVLVMEGANITATLGSIVKRKQLPLIDIGIAAEHFCLEAADLGLGTCMLGWFDENKVRKLLGITAGSRPVLIIPLGYPADSRPRVKTRKALDAIMSWNRYGDR